MTVFRWQYSLNSDWNSAAHWDQGSVPNASTADAIISSPGSYTITYSGLDMGDVVDSITLDAGGATLDVASLLILSGAEKQIRVEAGTLALQNGSTLVGAAVTLDGGAVTFGNGSTLDGVTWRGPLALDGATVYVKDGLTVQTLTGGAPGTIDLTTANSELDVIDSETLDNVVILAGPSSGYSYVDQTVAGTTLTLGAHAQFVQSAGDVAFYPSYSSDAVINLGTMSLSAGTFHDYLQNFTNAGTISLSNGEDFTLAQANSFNPTLTNTGLITVGANSVLGLNEGNFVSTGSVVVAAGGSVVLGGVFGLSVLSTITGPGAIDISGTLNLAGGTLDLKPGTTIDVGNGTIENGTIIEDGGALNFATNGSVLDAVTLRGNLSPNGNVLKIENGITVETLAGNLPGTIDLTQDDSELQFLNSATLDNVTILGPTSDVGSYIFSNFSGSDVVTLGSHALLLQSAGEFALYSGESTDQFVNLGTLATSGGLLANYFLTAANAGTIALSNGAGFNGYYNGTLTNSGVISIGAGSTVNFTNETLVNTGSVSVAATGTIDLGQTTSLASLRGITGPGTVNISGTLNLGSGTLDVSPSLGTLEISGTVENGTLIEDGGTLRFKNDLLQAITVLGTLTTGGQILGIAGGLTVENRAGGLPGTIDLTPSGSELEFEDNETLDNVTVLTGGSGTSNIYEQAAGGGTLTLGAHGLITQNAGVLELVDLYGNSTFVNLGTMSLANGILYSYFDFANAGTISLSGNEDFHVEEVDGGLFDNTGLITVGAGSEFDIGSNTLTNDGVVNLRGGVFAEGLGFGGVADTGGSLVIASTGTVFGFGTLSTPTANAGTIEAHGGNLQLVAPPSGVGVLQIDAASTLELVSAMADAVTFNGIGATLKLDAPAGYSGVLTNVAVGDTLFLAGDIATSASSSGTTLTIELSSGGSLTETLAAPLVNIREGITLDGAGDSEVVFYNSATASVAPTITGTQAGQSTTDEATVHPFSAIAITDSNTGNTTETATITLSTTNGTIDGTLSGAGLSIVTIGSIYTLTASSPTAMTTALQALTFTPTAHQTAPGGAITTGFTLAVSQNGLTTTNTTTSLLATAVNDTPVISGTGPVTTTDAASVAPFAHVAMTDPDNGATETVSIHEFNAVLDYQNPLTPGFTNGTLSGAGLIQTTTAGVYTLSGSPSLVTQEIDALSFTPTPHQVAPGQSVTTDFVIVDAQNGSSAYDGNTSVIATAVNGAPVIAGAIAGQTTTDEQTIKPFSSVVVTDAQAGVSDTATITLNPANGTLSGNGLISAGGGIYTLSAATPSLLSSALDGLIFGPTEHQVAPGGTITTGFTLAVSQGGATTTNTTTSVYATAVNDTPVISGAGPVASTDAASTAPFAHVAITDPDFDATETISIDEFNVVAGAQNPLIAGFGNGTLSGAGLIQTTTAGVYTLSGSPSLVTQEIDALSFTPTPHQVAPGQSVTTDFIIVANQNGSNAYDGNTSVITTAVNNAPVISGTVAGQVTTDYVPIKPFSSAVISDVDIGVTDSLTITLKGSSVTATDANGSLSGAGLTKTGVGTYVLSGAPSSLTAALQALTFTPTKAEVAAGNTVTTSFTLTATQNAGGVTTSATDTTTNVTTTALNYITGPSGGATFLFGTAGSDVMTALGSNNTFYGNGGSDYLNATSGSNNEFVLPNAGQGVDTITGFSETNGDILYMVNALLAAGYPLQGGNLANYVKVTDSGSNSILSVVPGGSGSGVTIAVLNGSANLGLTDLLSHNSLIT